MNGRRLIIGHFDHGKLALTAALEMIGAIDAMNERILIDIKTESDFPFPTERMIMANTSQHGGGFGTFGQMYGSNPRSTGNGGPKREKGVAASKRAAVKRRNIAKHSRR